MAVRAAAAPAAEGEDRMTTTTPQGTRLSAEEIGYLTAGPGRAAETALARLVDTGAVRVSRDGLVTAVRQDGQAATTSLERQVLDQLSTAVRFELVVESAAFSPEAQALHRYLVARRLMQPSRRRSDAWWTYLVLVAALLLLGVVSSPMFLIGVPVAVLLVVWARGREPLTKAGRQALLHATAHDRVHAVAVHGFCGKVDGRPVAGLFGLSQSVVRMLPRKGHLKKSTPDRGGSSCGSCGAGCGSSGCASSGSGCSSSGGSSCGGGGCGGGGGGD
ncbi:TIGR04222 domain-containing membrane protein [Lentzea chajnantorensis]